MPLRVHVQGKHGAAVLDGAAVVAVARPLTPHEGWRLKLYGGCWTRPEARAPSRVTGKPDPRFLYLATRAAALTELRALAATGAALKGDRR